jgi:hypothetical protein
MTDFVDIVARMREVKTNSSYISIQYQFFEFDPARERQCRQFDATPQKTDGLAILLLAHHPRARRIMDLEQ